MTGSVAEWLSNGRRLPAPSPAPGPTHVNELALAYLRRRGYYVKTRQADNGAGQHPPCDPAPPPTLRRYPGAGLRAARLKAVRQAMIESGLCRNEVNKRVRPDRPAVQVGRRRGDRPSLRPSRPPGGLGLRRGRADVRESEPVKPVPDAFVDAIQPYVSRQVWAMVQLQRLSGMRPGEVCMMRTIDMDTSGRVWVYTPESHKTEHHGRERRIYFGPAAQAILRPWLRTELTAYLFSPREAMEERRAELRRNRKTPVQPSQQGRRRKAKPKRLPGERYDTAPTVGHRLRIRRANTGGRKRRRPGP